MNTFIFSLRPSPACEAGMATNHSVSVCVYPVKFFEENKRSEFNWGVSAANIES
jgi:hypothetical protein